MRRISVAMLLMASASGAGAFDMKKFLELDSKYLACMDAQALRLDDGRSDARSVASAVYAACGPDKMAAVATAGFSSQDAAAKAVRDSRDQDIDRATIAVLKVRKR